MNGEAASTPAPTPAASPAAAPAATLAPTPPSPAARPSVALVALLWLAQAAVAVVFVGAGLFKLSAPIAELAAAMPWAGAVPPTMVRLIGAIDLAGGLGILLPALTRILPHLTVWAALGCAVLQALAMAFHAARGEWSVLPLNVGLLAAVLWVWWGRRRRAPVLPRD